MGSIVMTEIKVDNIVDVAGTGKPNFLVAPTHSTGSALSTINTYQYDTTTRVVTVVNDGGNKFAIDGVTAPTITLLRGVTYTFDVSDSSVSTHPLAFKNAGTSYTTGITSSGTAGTAGATVTFVVAADAPLTGLTYYCTTHGDGMGSSVTTSDPKNGAMLWDGAVKFYVDSEFKAIGASDSGGGSGTINGDRGVFAGGQSTTQADGGTIDYISIPTPGNASDFGDMHRKENDDPNPNGFDTRMRASASNGTRGIMAGNATGGFNIDYITFATPSNSATFGDLTVGRTSFPGGSSDGTKAYIFGGKAGSTWQLDIDVVTIDTTGNATDWGYDIKEGYSYASTLHNTQYAILFGGVKEGITATNSIDYFSMANPANAADFGNLGAAYQYQGGASSSTRGLMFGGRTFGQGTSYRNNIEYITIGTSGSVTDFGDMTAVRYGVAATSNGTRAVSAGGENSGGYVNIMEYVTIDTTGNATDFGDLSYTRHEAQGLSGAAS